MAYIGLDGLLMAGVNIVGVLGPKKDHNMYSDFKNFTLSRGLNYIDYDELNEPQLIETIQRLDVDAAVVCSFNYKIPKVLLNSTKDGFINVHPSLLPKYRGGNPYSRVIMNGEAETGVQFILWMKALIRVILLRKSLIIFIQKLLWGLFLMS
jgi:methionyl-tRNA formyltransferase